MKKISIVGIGVMIITLITACSQPNDCRISGRVSLDDYEATTIYLVDPYTHEIEDSSVIEKGVFHFAPIAVSTPDQHIKQLTIHLPELYNMQLVQPVVIEKGNISVEMGEYQCISGSRMNDRLGEFQEDLQRMITQYEKSSTGMLGSLKKEISGYITLQAKKNKDNVLGPYILQNYSDRIVPEVYDELKKDILFKY